jgi:hypothetical protein
VPETQGGRSGWRWDGYTYSREDDGEPNHLTLRDGSWLIDNPRQKRAYQEALRHGYKHEAALVYAADPRYQRVVKVVSPMAYMTATGTEPTTGTRGPDLPWAYILHRLIEADGSLEGRLGPDAALLIDIIDEDDEPIAVHDLVRAGLKAKQAAPWLPDDADEVLGLSEPYTQAEWERDELVKKAQRLINAATDAKRPASLDGVKRSEGNPKRVSRTNAYRRAQRARKTLGRQK